MKAAYATLLISAAFLAAPAAAEPMVEAFEARCLSALQQGVAVDTQGLEPLTAESLGRDPMKMAAALPPEFFALPGGDGFMGVLYFAGLQGCMIGDRSGHSLAPEAFAEMVENAGLAMHDTCGEDAPDIAVATEPNSIGRYFMVSHSTSKAGNDELMGMERNRPYQPNTCDTSNGGGN